MNVTIRVENKLYEPYCIATTRNGETNCAYRVKRDYLLVMFDLAGQPMVSRYFPTKRWLDSWLRERGKD